MSSGDYFTCSDMSRMKIVQVSADNSPSSTEQDPETTVKQQREVTLNNSKKA